MIRLKDFTTAAEGHLARQRLEQAGIPAFLRNENIHGVLPVDVLSVQLWVQEEDEARALEILAPSADAADREEDYRDIDEAGIAWLRKRQDTRKWLPWLWIGLAILILLLLIAGW